MSPRANAKVEGMGVDDRIKRILLQRGILVSKAVRATEVAHFLARFRQNYVAVDLIRVGGQGDGGYLVPELLDDVTHCFSPGVSDTADFEHELSTKYNIKSFMADASVSSPPLVDKNFFFIKKFLGSRSSGEFVTLSDWLDASLDGTEGDVILQMDIEGGEYDVLTLESEDTLKRFSMMVIEFHSLQKIFEKHFLQMLTSIFEKIYRNFSIVHVHPNNCCGVAMMDSIEIPRVIEVTFVRHDVLNGNSTHAKISLPHFLDEKNIAGNDDIVMPEVWWKSNP
jgi:hypothetical protein